MEVRTLLKRGTDHLLNCEDDLFTFNDGTTYIGAVFDGCSTGVKSHFTSALYGKILKAYFLNRSTLFTLDETPLNYIGKSIFYYLHANLKKVQILLTLDTLEILSTMILVVIRDNKAYTLVSGDGCISVNYKDKSGEDTKIESPENAPDYLAYHLENAAEAFASLKEESFENMHSISICSDGIYSFTDKDRKDCSDIVMTSLLDDEAMIKSGAMLGRKYNLLVKAGYTNYDDLSIVRFIL